MKAKYFDFTKTRVFCIIDDPVPNIYEKLNSVNPRANGEAKQRYNWFGYGEEIKGIENIIGDCDEKDRKKRVELFNKMKF